MVILFSFTTSLKSFEAPSIIFIKVMLCTVNISRTEVTLYPVEYRLEAQSKQSSLITQGVRLDLSHSSLQITCGPAHLNLSKLSYLNLLERARWCMKGSHSSINVKIGNVFFYSPLTAVHVFLHLSCRFKFRAVFFCLT